MPLLLADATNSYLYGPGGTPIEQIDGARQPTYLHHDALGSTRVLTEARGAASGTFTYSPYGSLTGRTGTQTTPLGFAGQYTDAESGLQYLRARYLDPATGQFMTRDPITAITQEPYAYAGGNPLAATDPSGLIRLPTPRDVLHVALDALAVPPYLMYYMNYQGAKAVNELGSQLGTPGKIASHATALQFVPGEALGLGGDVGIDWIKGRTVNDESICDEGVTEYINPFHQWLPGPLKGPKTRLPGVRAGGGIDFEW